LYVTIPFLQLMVMLKWGNMFFQSLLFLISAVNVSSMPIPGKVHQIVPEISGKQLPIYKTSSSLNYKTESSPELEVFGASLFQTLGGVDNTSSFLAIDIASTPPISHVRYRITDYQQQQGPSLGWKNRFQKLTNVASILCVLDCTLLPVFTIVIPLLSDTSTIQLQWLHDAGHMLALGFVIPMGTVTTFFNYLSHRQWKLVLISMLGIALIGLTNSDISPIAHDLLHHGWTHRLINIMGCGFLLTSNYFSRRQLHQDCDC